MTFGKSSVPGWFFSLCEHEVGGLRDMADATGKSSSARTLGHSSNLPIVIKIDLLVLSLVQRINLMFFSSLCFCVFLSC